MKHHFQKLLVSVLLFIPSLCLAWGPQGHQTVGAIADQLLIGTKAAEQVHLILGDSSLQIASIWADCAKGATSQDDLTFNYHQNSQRYPECDIYSAPDEVEAFISYVGRNWKQCGSAHGSEYCHNQYHYADISSFRDHYDERFTGANNHDIVHSVNAAIAVLKDQSPPAPFNIRDKKEALRLLAHLVGDIHQPLHVVSVYLDANGNHVDPDAAGYKIGNDTAGGNNIKDGSHNLHSDWDDIPSKWAVNGSEFNQVLEAAKIEPVASDSPGNWAKEWASDTIQIGRYAAFDHLQFTMQPNSVVSPESTPEKWVIGDLPASYKSTENDIKLHQLAKAGAHLAQLLESVWLDPSGRSQLYDVVLSEPVHGYLTTSELGNIKQWLPSAPQPHSAAQNDDITRYKQTRALIKTARGQSAAEDDVFPPEQLLPRFNSALGVELTKQNVPSLINMVAKIEQDASQMISPVKLSIKDGGRVRPFVAYPKQPSCLSPVDLANKYNNDINTFHLNQSGSYPSTHALMGMIVGMILTEAAPDKMDLLIARGIEFGESRLVCGFHYNSDLVAGRLAASVLFSRLQTNPAFKDDLQKSVDEINKIKSSL